MRWHVIKRQVRNSWRRRWIRVTTALTCLTAAICVQYLVSRVPEPQNVEAAEARYTPAKARVKKQEIVVYDPSVPSIRTVLPAFDGEKNQTVEVHATRAKLSDDTIDFLQDVIQGQLPAPPEGFEKIDYFVREDDLKDSATKQGRNSRADSGNQGSYSDDTCHMSIRIAPVDKLPTEIHFYQPEIGNQHFQTLEIRPKDADLEVQLKQKNPVSNKPDSEGNPWARGCSKTLKVKDW